MLKFLLPVSHLLIDVLDVTLEVHTLSSSCKDSPGAPTLDQSAKESLSLELFQNELFGDPAEEVSTPYFLDQSCTEIADLFLECFLFLFSRLSHHEHQILDEPCLFTAICNRQ